MGRERRTISRGEGDTLAFGAELVSQFPQGGIFCLNGDLGAGKTTLVKGIVAALTSIAKEEVCSPTFSYLTIYDDLIYHFDLYRLTSLQEFQALGLEDFIYAKGFVCIEWSERIAPLLPPERITLTIEMIDPTQRAITCD